MSATCSHCDTAVEVAAWLVESGYPYDYRTDTPLPPALREVLAEAWLAAEGIPGETVDDYRLSLADEGGWDA